MFITYHFTPIKRKQIHCMGDIKKQQQTSDKNTEKSDKHHKPYSADKRQHKQPHLYCSRCAQTDQTSYGSSLKKKTGLLDNQFQ